MTLKIIKHYLILLVIFFSWAGVANASLEITEVMYDPEGTDTNREWIKLYNDGSENINIISGKTNSAWRFGDGENGEALHYISDSLDIGPGEYAILASDKDTYIPEYSYSGLIADTSMSLNNTSGVVKIWDGSSPRKVVSLFEYNANDSTDGNNESTSSNEDNSNSSTKSTTSSSKIEIPEVFKITTKIISPKNVTAGIPFSLNSLTTTNRGETYAVGKFVWNFGDGMVREIDKSSLFDYIYEYPGEYVLTLSYFDSHFSEVADATDRITIKVIPSEIYISSVGNSADPFIELENKSNYEIILSNWVVTAGVHYFIIPEGTTLLPGKKIKLSPKITGFIGEDIKSVTVTSPSKIITANYPIQTKKSTQKNSSINNISSNNFALPDNNLQDNSLLKDSEVINLNDLGAEASGSGINIPNSAYPLIGLLVVIGLGISSFLLIKMRNKDDDLLDKKIRAEDITIIE